MVSKDDGEVDVPSFLIPFLDNKNITLSSGSDYSLGASGYRKGYLIWERYLLRIPI